MSCKQCVHSAACSRPARGRRGRRHGLGVHTTPSVPGRVMLPRSAPGRAWNAAGASQGRGAPAEQPVDRRCRAGDVRSKPPTCSTAWSMRCRAFVIVACRSCSVECRGAQEPWCAIPSRAAPQAWASAAPYLLLQASLLLQVDGPGRRLIIRNASLPTRLDWVALERLPVGRSRVTLRLRRAGERVHIERLDVTGPTIRAQVEFQPHAAGDAVGSCRV
jgi:hypothetical protein